MKLRYTAQALAELDEVLTYIAERSPAGSSRVHARIHGLVRLVAEHPEIGQPTSVPRLRRIAATPFPYLVFYQTSEEETIIIGVRHAARDPATMPGRGTL